MKDKLVVGIADMKMAQHSGELITYALGSCIGICLYDPAIKLEMCIRDSQVTVMENVPLARALYASTELNRPIPPEFYNAVAEVLVYIYRMDSSLKQGGK